jgi:hypothetical protein
VKPGMTVAMSQSPAKNKKKAATGELGASV